MKVENMRSANGNMVPNQFIITDKGNGGLGNFDKREVFQSYTTMIARITQWKDETRIEIDHKWNCSKTTSKYRAMFLGESTEKTQKKIDSGEYILTDLN
jgi:hypothetical protein